MDISQPSFHTYPLIVECDLINGSSMEPKMLFDGSAISAEKIQQLVAHVNQVIGELYLASFTRRTLDTINMFSAEDKVDVLAWHGAVQTKIMDTCVHEAFK
jgi:hypothetical protein